MMMEVAVVDVEMVLILMRMAVVVAVDAVGLQWHL